MLWILFLVVLVLPTAIYLLFMSPRSQIFGRYPYKGTSSEKLVSLTFDDGPNQPYTSELLAILRKEKVKATFFLVGNCAKRHPAVAASIVKAGHVIGNHSESHTFSTYLKPGKFIREIVATQKILEHQTAKKPVLVRTPWLWRQPFLLHNLKKLGLLPVAGIFCHPKEVFGANSQQIADYAISRTRPGTILIFHDGKEGVGGDRSQTIASIPLVVSALKEQGYKFVTLDELLKISPY